MDSYSMYNHKSLFSADEDRCNECDEKRVKDCCNKCGEGLCLSVSCCQTFPHYQNDLYIICNACITDIEQKLRPTSVDKCDLQLLKQKISKRMKSNIKKLEYSIREREQDVKQEQNQHVEQEVENEL